MVRPGDRLGAGQVFEFVRAHQAMYPMTVCRLLDVSTSGYYAWLKREPSARTQREGELRRAIRRIHTASFGTYGVPRIHAELTNDGTPISRKRVARQMRAEGL